MQKRILFTRTEKCSTTATALVTFDFDGDKIRDERELLTAIREGVKSWLESPDGEDAREYAGDDFNVGDLDGYGSADLMEHLNKHGITGVVMEEINYHWSYDRPLTFPLRHEDDE